jgi:hypothetical protein
VSAEEVEQELVTRSGRLFSRRCTCVGAKPPRHLPLWLGRLIAGEALATMVTEGRGASNAKAKRELGWQPLYPSWRGGFVNGLGADTRRAA